MSKEIEEEIKKKLLVALEKTGDSRFVEYEFGYLFFPNIRSKGKTEKRGKEVLESFKQFTGSYPYAGLITENTKGYSYYFLIPVGVLRTCPNKLETVRYIAGSTQSKAVH